MIMILLLLVRPDGALTARAMEPARHGSLRRELTSAICAPPAQNTVLEASAIPRPTTMTAHAGEPSHYYKYKNVWALSRSCSTLGAEHQGLTLSEGSGDRASAGATSVGCSSLWLSCPGSGVAPEGQGRGSSDGRGLEHFTSCRVSLDATAALPTLQLRKSCSDPPRTLGFGSTPRVAEANLTGRAKLF